MDRRAFISRGGRILIFSGMLAGTAFLTFSGKITSPEDCHRSDRCKKCKKSSDCHKYQAKINGDGKR
jgi:hypothetical protein